ncbi:MAG: nucleoside hydrolase [Anaerolineae bacterium]|nr:nucleoside hydrolase [Anaerolineae bacterium]
MFQKTILSPLFQIIPFLVTPAKSLPPRAPLAARLNGPRRPVIVDTDMSHDDMAAILYLLQRREIDLVGITVVNGVTHVANGVENLRRLLALAGREDIPVAGGPAQPLAGANTFPEFWRQFADLTFRLNCPPAVPAPAVSAPALIGQLVAASPTPVQIIALGPLTNIALALQANPALAAQLDSIVVGGGAVYVPGCIHEEDAANPNQVAEWNLWLDPTAADFVFRSGAKLVVAPLDVTHIHGPSPLLISRRLAHEFSRAAARWRETKFMARIIKGLFWIQPGVKAVPVWDAVTAAIAVEPTIGTDWRDLPLQINTHPPEITGQTVVNKTGPPNARVCLGGNQVAFEAAFLAAANSLDNLSEPQSQPIDRAS